MSLSCIKLTLHNFLESGNLADVEFLIGPQKVRVKAHKTILLMRSEVFGPMLSTRWIKDHLTISSTEAVDDKLIQIEIPNLDPQVFRAFLKYLYTDEIAISEDDIRTDELLDLLEIADLYGVIPLFDKISDTIESNLSIDNCVNIYESTKVLNQELCQRAFLYMKSNISQLIHYNAYLETGKDGHWSLNTWTEILESDGMVVEEVELLVGITKWAEGDEDRMQHLRTTLLSLIRYSIMTSQEFAEFVVKSELLPNIDVIKILLFFIDYKGNHSKSCLPYQLQSRTLKRPTSSTELTYFLKRSNPGDIIHLFDRHYEGSFSLSSSYVTVLGDGPNSALVTRDKDAVILTVEGNRCAISGLKFQHDFVEDHRSVKPLLQISGHRNTLENLEMNTGCYWTEISLPDGSVTSNKLLKQNPCFAIAVGGDWNSIINLVCVNRGNGITVEINCQGNSIVGLTSRHSTDGQSRSDFGTAVFLQGGKDHVLQDICGDWYLRLGDESQNVVTSGCDLLGVNVDGIGHDFVRLKAKKWVKIKGHGHSFDELCEAGRWDGNRE